LRSVADKRRDIAVLKTYGAAPYANALKKLEKQIKERQASVNEKIGVKVRFDRTFLQRQDADVSRNPTLVSHHHIYGTLPRIGNAWQRSSRCRWLVARRSFKTRRIQTRANM
jgi:hypothetical protein